MNEHEEKCLSSKKDKLPGSLGTRVARLDSCLRLYQLGVSYSILYQSRMVHIFVPCLIGSCKYASFIMFFIKEENLRPGLSLN